VYTVIYLLCLGEHKRLLSKTLTKSCIQLQTGSLYWNRSTGVTLK